MAVDMMDAIEEFLAKGLPGVKVSLGKGKVVAKSESSSSWMKLPLTKLPDLGEGSWSLILLIDLNLVPTH